MIALTAVMCLLLGYQVTMPAVDNAKYTVTVYEGQLIRMNTQNGKFEVCDKELNCQPKDQ
jgi:hypothetical protein